MGDALDVAPSPEDDPDRPLGTERLRWLTEPEEARTAGMLLTVRDADLSSGAGLGAGLDELIVLGVDSTQSPDGGAGDLARLLAAHLYGDGLSFVPQGTPTNNTAETPSGHSSAPAALAGALDPAATVPGDLTWSAGARLAAALGIAPAPLAGAPGAGVSEHAVASALIDATWEATAGTYLGRLLRPVGRIRPMISDADIDQLRVWASAHLFASGPLPLVRIGRQPYGLLPVVNPASYRPPAGDRAAEMVAGTTAKLRRWWVQGSRAVPRLDRTTDLDATLVDLLQRAPVAATARFRRALPRGAVANVVGLDDLAQQQELHGWLVESMLDGRFSPRRLTIGTLTTDARSHALRIPWARPAGLDPGATLPYVRELRDLLTTPGGRDTLATRGGAASLAEALLALSAALELDAAHGRVVKDFADIGATPSPLVEAVRLRHPETIGTGLEEVDGGALSFATPKVLADARIPGLTGAGTVADLVRDHLAGAGGGDSVDGLRRLRAALDRLADEPGERVEWALRGLLDLYSYRFDAWCTALATQRLTDLRAARPAGVHLGAYGWVEDVRPDPAGRDSLGYVHTPSLNHAVAAAVLRSAHVARASSTPGAFAVDLSARRVRDAMTLLDGVENGQPLGALLGYRIERLLRERDAILARYILPLRRLAPLRHTDADLSEPVESIAARDVVDGVALLEKWRAPGGRDAVLSGIGILGQHGTPVGAVLDTADDLLDAVGDVLLSEAVYQTVAGNQDRAGAALAALDRQQRPVAPEVVQSPRSGTTVAHRVLVLLRNSAAPGWPADPRSGAEPRLNAWVARLLGPPASVVFAGEVRRGGMVRATVTATLAELGLSPLAVVLAVRRPAGDRPSELESRLAAAMAAKVPDGTEDDSLVLLPDGAGGAWGLEAIATVAAWVERIAGRPPASAPDLQPLLHDEPAGWDVAELAERADRVVAALTAAAGRRRPRRAGAGRGAGRRRQPAGGHGRVGRGPGGTGAGRVARGRRAGGGRGRRLRRAGGPHPGPGRRAPPAPAAHRARRGLPGPAALPARRRRRRGALAGRPGRIARRRRSRPPALAAPGGDGAAGARPAVGAADRGRGPRARPRAAPPRRRPAPPPARRALGGTAPAGGRGVPRRNGRSRRARAGRARPRRPRRRRGRRRVDRDHPRGGGDHRAVLPLRRPGRPSSPRHPPRRPRRAGHGPVVLRRAARRRARGHRPDPPARRRAPGPPRSRRPPAGALRAPGRHRRRPLDRPLRPGRPGRARRRPARRARERLRAVPPENPSVVGWSRLEPVPATGDLEPGLQAPLADPLWLLARQWQFGELHGDDAGTPVEVRLLGHAAPLSRYLAGHLDAGAGARAVDYATLAAPLEPVVEAEPVRAGDDRLRREAGLHFLRLLAAADLVRLGHLYLAQYPAARPVLGAVVVDGGRLAADLEPLADAAGNLGGLPPAPALNPTDAGAVRPVAEAWLRWWRAQVYEPARPAAWDANRMEYSLAVQADFDGSSVVLAADEYAGGRLDWYSFDAVDGVSLGPPASPPDVVKIDTVTLPARASYPGMPADRLWQFEDARVFLGRTTAGPTDLARMLLVEFALAFGNDWYVTPVELPAGAVFRLEALTVRDTFGIETVVPPSVDLGGRRWTMFSTAAGATGRDIYFVPPTLPSTLDADPREEVALFRDEMANLVWAVERVVAGPGGERVERAREPGRAALRQQLPGDLGDAQLIYRLMTPVPDHWIPFVPVPAEGVAATEGAVELLRGAILRFRADGTTDLAHPHGLLLRADPAADPADDRLRLLEEEVPRAGVVVRRLLQLARTAGGGTVVWLGRDKHAGRGEGSSGMRFDAADPPA